MAIQNQEMEYSFNVDYAKSYGLKEAIMIKNFQYWIIKNKSNKVNFHDDRFWTYNSAVAFQKLFPFWSKHQVVRILQSLVKQGVLIEGNYNKISYDRTKWYAFKDEPSFLNMPKSILQNSEKDVAKVRKASRKKSPPIPDTKTKDNKLSYYKEMVAIYDTFCLEFLDVPARINGAEGKALKEITQYLVNIANKKGLEESTCLDSFSYIFNHWSMLDKFTRGQVKLIQINSNLPNIINQLKNGTEKRNSSTIADEILAKYK